MLLIRQGPLGEGSRLTVMRSLLDKIQYFLRRFRSQRRSLGKEPRTETSLEGRKILSLPKHAVSPKNKTFQRIEELSAPEICLVTPSCRQVVWISPKCTYLRECSIRYLRRETSSQYQLSQGYGGISGRNFKYRPSCASISKYSERVEEDGIPAD